jgi:hypothetical protein
MAVEPDPPNSLPLRPMGDALARSKPVVGARG